MSLSIIVCDESQDGSKMMAGKLPRALIVCLRKVQRSLPHMRLFHKQDRGGQGKALVSLLYDAACQLQKATRRVRVNMIEAELLSLSFVLR